MPWPCYMVVYVPDSGSFFRLPDGQIVHFNDLAPGAMWWEDEEKTELVVKLPSNSEWNIDRGRILNSQKAGRNYPAWNRTGDPPNITAKPSINHVGKYHGWLENGVLTDDCEGRKF